MKRIFRFLWRSGFAIILIMIAVGILNMFFPTSTIPRPEGNGLLLTLRQVAIFTIRPGMFILPGGLVLIVWIVMFSSSDGRQQLAKIWRQSA